MLFTQGAIPLPTTTVIVAVAVGAVIVEVTFAVPVTVTVYVPAGVVAATFTLIGVRKSFPVEGVPVGVGMPTDPPAAVRVSVSVSVTWLVKPPTEATSAVL